MATLEQANTYQAIRENEDWAELAPALGRALLQDAEDYIRGTYPVRSDLTLDEQQRFDAIVCRLAGIFQAKPPQDTATPAVKKEAKEGAGFKKEVEYAETGSDPYPYITAVIRPLLRTASGATLYQGKVTA